MDDDCIYKIRDSVDIFLSNGRYITAYYMNSRQRKTFKVNEETVHLLENIDGERTLLEIKEYMRTKYNVNPLFVEIVVADMVKNRILTKLVNHDSIILSQDYIERYTRQINYFSEFLNSEEDGVLSQKKVMDSKIIIFGCGAVGGNIAIELAMAGVSHIVLYDFDKVERSDTARHLFYKERYENLDKVTALANELRQINSNIDVQAICKSMKPKTNIEELIRTADFVVNTMDEPYIGYTSSKISRVCIKHKIAHFIAGGFDAHLASTGELIIPYITPCVECYANHFKESLRGWKPRKHPVKMRSREIGGLASMSLFSSSYACIEILKYIAGLLPMNTDFKIRGEFLFYDMSLTYLHVKKDPNCPICGRALK